MFESSDILASVSVCVDERRTAGCEEEEEEEKKSPGPSLKEEEKDSGLGLGSGLCEQQQWNRLWGTYRALCPLVEIDTSLGLTYKTMGHVFKVD